MSIIIPDPSLNPNLDLPHLETVIESPGDQQRADEAKDNANDVTVHDDNLKFIANQEAKPNSPFDVFTIIVGGGGGGGHGGHGGKP